MSHRHEIEEFEVDDVSERINSSRGSRLKLLENRFRWHGNNFFNSEENVIQFRRGCPIKIVIHPDSLFYKGWTIAILVVAVYSSFFTPLEFGFFHGLPGKLGLFDILGQVAFFVDILILSSLAYRDPQTYRWVYDNKRIFLRYARSTLVLDVLSTIPWDIVYKITGRHELVKYLLWIRLSRVRKVTDFFHHMEKNVHINYLFTRIVKLIAVELYCTHTAACIFYYLATTLPASEEGYTWIGSLTLGDFSYTNFRDIDWFTRYITSLYFAIVTMSTVGYGDIHAVNVKEMIFVMIYVSFDMILGAYLIGNMTALIVKGSKTERFRDKLKDLMTYMNRNNLAKDIFDQVKGHLRLEYESSYTEAAVLNDSPISIRAKISQTLYRSFVEAVPLFKGCSSEFINQIVIRVHEEFFQPGEVIMEQGNAVDQLYFICDGMLEEIGVGEDGSEETLQQLQPPSSFGEISIICNIPQPHTVRVCELCRLLRLDKQSFSNILQIYFVDGRTILSNILEGRESSLRKQLESDVAYHIAKQEAELALRVISAAYHGDLFHLKGLIRAGADPNNTDYDGRSALHLAATKGYEDVTAFLILEGVNLNLKDNFGNTPLLEAIRSGNDIIASMLVKEKAVLSIDDAGSLLCKVVSKGDSDFLKRLLLYGVDPNVKDYDHRTPLHIAASDGLYLMVKILLDAGANVFSRDRWGNTPLDEGIRCGSKPIVDILEGAKSSRDLQARVQRKTCVLFPFHPWDPKEHRKEGLVVWTPETLDDLLAYACKQLGGSYSYFLSEDGARITDVDMIRDGQKLYLTSNINDPTMFNAA